MVIHGAISQKRFAGEMDVDRLIGWNFRRLRLGKKLSQEEIALRLGTVDQGYLSQLEDGQRNPTARTLYRLAGALDVNVGELFAVDGASDSILKSDRTTVKKTRAGRSVPRERPRGKITK